MIDWSNQQSSAASISCSSSPKVFWLQQFVNAKFGEQSWSNQWFEPYSAPHKTPYIFLLSIFLLIFSLEYKNSSLFFKWLCLVAEWWTDCLSCRFTVTNFEMIINQVGFRWSYLAQFTYHPFNAIAICHLLSNGNLRLLSLLFPTVTLLNGDPKL